MSSSNVQDAGAPGESGESGDPGGPDLPPEPHLVLLIEDDPSDVAIVKALLGGFVGWQLLSVPTLAAAQRTLRTTPVEVVILDLGLPDAAGLEALSAVLSMHGVPPVVVLTGADESGLGSAAIDMGAEDFLPKSVLSSSTADVVLERAIRYATTRFRQRRMLQRESAELRWLTARQQRLIEDMTRDLQQPVTALFGLVTTLTERQRVLRAAERNELVRKIERATRSLGTRLAEIIADADPISGSTLARRQLRMADIVPAAINSVGGRPEGTRVSLDGDLPVVWGRPDALQAAIAEMVRNAVVHAGENASPKIRVEVTAYGNGVRITVSDNGEPVPMALRSTVFEAGVTVDDRSSRDGMGLSHVRAVAAEHGGAVWLDDSDMGGTSITLAVPQRGRMRDGDEDLGMGSPIPVRNPAPDRDR